MAIKTNARRRFPPPWRAEEYRGISYIVRDATVLRGGVCLLRVADRPTRCGQSHDQRRREKDRGWHSQAAGAVAEMKKAAEQAVRKGEAPVSWSLFLLGHQSSLARRSSGPMRLIARRML